ncbi:MAG: cation:proton antiporter [Woeseiaceae bacterium]
MHSLVHLALIWAAVLAAAVAAKKTRLTPVFFYLFIGFLLVNVGVLPKQSGPFIREFAELGIIFIMFALGFEESTENFIGSLKKSWGIALFGALGPFAVTYVITDTIWNDPDISLMCALAMTATAVSVTMVSLRGEGLQNSVVATRIMTSAVIDDIGALVALAIMVPLAVGQESFSMASLVITGGKAALFFVVVTIIGAWIFPHKPAGWFRHVPVIGRFGVKHMLTFDHGRYATLIVLLVALVVGLLAYYFGFHPAIGAYMAGLIVKEEYFDIVEKKETGVYVGRVHSAYEETKIIIDNAAFLWIGPVFFVDLGAKLIFDRELMLQILPYAVVLTIGLFVVQVSTAGLAAKYTGGMTWHQSLMIGFGMLGRAELAFVVMDIAYVQHQILHVDAFFTLMITAFFLNVAVPLTIRWWRPYYNAAAARSV